jgi:hypothetical protein
MIKQSGGGRDFKGLPPVLAARAAIEFFLSLDFDFVKK